MTTQEKHSGPTCKTCRFYENNCPYPWQFIVYPSRGCKDYTDSTMKAQEMLAVDLEKEIQRYLCEECSSDDEPTITEIARHFYELGLKARKEE